MRDKLCFVQFLHPGSEHWPDAVGIKEWTKSADGHGRKFLRVPGLYLRDLNDRRIEGEIGFWGEWEAPSEVEATDDPPPYGPRLIHRPFWSLQKTYRGLHNTDPFVFVIGSSIPDASSIPSGVQPNCGICHADQ